MSCNRSNFLSRCQSDLIEYGHFLYPVYLEEVVKDYIKYEDYESIDKHFAKETSPDGEIFKTLLNFCNFNEIEFIISLRSAQNDWEEDGIWHDDGSRKLAFSLSLTQVPPEGGVLELRKKGTKISNFLVTPAFGQMIVFKTGTSGYEHKINAVTRGSRLIIAGWCS